MWMNKQLAGRDLFPSAQEPLTAHISSVINYLVFPKHPSLLTFTSLQTLSLLFISAGKRFLLHTEALVADWVAAAAVDRLCFRQITLSTQSLKFCCVRWFNGLRFGLFWVCLTLLWFYFKCNKTCFHSGAWTHTIERSTTAATLQDLQQQND